MADETPERRAGSYLPPHARSQNSSNWRTKDETPRSENPTSYRNRGPQSPTGVDLVSPTNANYEAAAGTRLYVGNLLYTASRDDVEQLFVSHGFNITGISMSIDPFTNRNPSYAFVDFETAEEASKAMDGINGQELLGREVKVNPGVRRQSAQGERRVKNFANGTPQRESTQRKPAALSFLDFTNRLQATTTTLQATTAGPATTAQRIVLTLRHKDCVSMSVISHVLSLTRPAKRPSSRSSRAKASRSRLCPRSSRLTHPRLKSQATITTASSICTASRTPIMQLKK